MGGVHAAVDDVFALLQKLVELFEYVELCIEDDCMEGVVDYVVEVAQELEHYFVNQVGEGDGEGGVVVVEYHVF